jgi:hypothetical protein
MSMLDDCSNYLDGTIYNLQQKLVNFEEQDDDIRNQLYHYDTQQTTKPPKKYMYGYEGDSDSDQYGIKKKDNDEQSEADSTTKNSRKLAISQKLFKLRYLSKCHL